MVMNMGPDYNNKWIIYYTGTNPDALQPNVLHVVYCRTSDNLIAWSNPTIAFEGLSGDPSGGPTESPFGVRRGKNFYLFTGSWAGYRTTRVFLSNSPTNFGSVAKGTAVQVGQINSHALEVVRDVTGNWFISHAGWGQGGLYLAPITWHDGLDNQPTSMDPPTHIPDIPPKFITNVVGWKPTPVDSTWVLTPDGLQAEYALGNAFYIGTTSDSNLTFEATITLITNDGNPTTGQNPWTRVGSAAALIFRCQDQSNPLSGAYAVNLFTNSGGGIKAFKFPYVEIATYPYPIKPRVAYHLMVLVGSGPGWTVFFSEVGNQDKIVIEVEDSSYTTGYIGVNVWQGSALFDFVRTR
jgi:hypothetical protein